MKFGMSCYCLDPAMEAGRMSIDDVIDYAVAHGCEHIEFVPFHLAFVTPEQTLDLALIDHVREKCQSAGIEISTYSVNADLLKTDPAEEAKEIERVKRHIDAAQLLGLTRMRFDVASFRRPFSTNTIYNFNREFPQMVRNGALLCDYAAEKGITIVMENHGFFINGSDRVLRLIEAIDRPNLKMTVDVGNFLCVDDVPEVAVGKCIRYANMIHLKDFYIRKKERMLPQEGMYTAGARAPRPTPPTPEELRRMPPRLGYVGTASGRTILRGAILGQGDMDIWDILATIKSSGYDREISIEFEGMEDCCAATDICLRTARHIWERV